MSDEAGDDAAKDDWVLDYAGRAEKDVSRLDPPMRRRVLAALGKLAADPHAGQLRKLTGSPSPNCASETGASSSRSTRRLKRSKSSACCPVDARTTAEERV
jgi:hypothetical protein